MRAHITTTAACAALALGAAATAMPAAAQAVYDPYTGSYVDEVVVPGRYYRGDRPMTLSRAVSYRDLDLSTYQGQRVLKMRIRATARDLCRELGEGRGNGGPLLRSCEDDAVRSARSQTRYAIARAQARSYYASLY